MCSATLRTLRHAHITHTVIAIVPTSTSHDPTYEGGTTAGDMAAGMYTVAGDKAAGVDTANGCRATSFGCAVQQYSCSATVALTPVRNLGKR